MGGMPRCASLTLGVLRTATRFATADLLALDLARIARDEPGIAQWLAQRLIVLEQGTGDAVADRAGLTGDATAIDRDVNVEPAHELYRLERLTHDHAPGLAAEEGVERALVDGDLAAAGLQIDARGGRLAPAGAVVILLGRCHGSLRPIGVRAALAAAPDAGARRRQTRAAS